MHHVGILYDQFMMHGQRNIKLSLLLFGCVWYLFFTAVKWYFLLTEMPLKYCKFVPSDKLIMDIEGNGDSVLWLIPELTSLLRMWMWYLVSRWMLHLTFWRQHVPLKCLEQQTGCHIQETWILNYTTVQTLHLAALLLLNLIPCEIWCSYICDCKDVTPCNQV